MKGTRSNPKKSQIWKKIRITNNQWLRVFQWLTFRSRIFAASVTCNTESTSGKGPTAWREDCYELKKKTNPFIWSIIDRLFTRWLVSGKQRESDLDNKHPPSMLRRLYVTAGWREASKRETASLPSLDVFPLFSLLMSVRMQVSLKEKERERDGREKRRKTKQQQSKKRPKERTLLIKCLPSIYGKLYRHAVERWCRAEAHKSWGGGYSKAWRERETQMSLWQSHEHIIMFSLFSPWETDG